MPLINDSGLNFGLRSICGAWAHLDLSEGFERTHCLGTAYPLRIDPGNQTRKAWRLNYFAMPSLVQSVKDRLSSNRVDHAHRQKKQRRQFCRREL